MGKKMERERAGVKKGERKCFPISRITSACECEGARGGEGKGESDLGRGDADL